MTTQCILAIDQGTTNTKVLLVEATGKIIARAVRPLTQSYPRPAWVEQDAAAIWQSVSAAIDDCLNQAGDPPLSGIAITNQRETVTIWERSTGRPLGPAVSWQCSRGAAFCEALRARHLERMIHERTGLTIDPMFSGSKARWLLDNIPHGQQRAEQGELCLGTIDSWVLWNLTGGTIYACDVTNASRTQLFNLHHVRWDDDLLATFGIPAPALPEVRLSSTIFGASAPCGRLHGGVPIAGVIGDSHGALYGHASFAPGSVKATYGTGSSLMSPTTKPIMSRHGISTTIAWGRQTVTYALEGNIYVTGAAVQWLGETLGLDDTGQGIEQLASQVEDTGGVYLVPAFVGLGAPHWQSKARGLICGITRGTTRAHLARAVLEAIAYQVRDVFDAMELDAGRRLELLLADGGASRNHLLMQFQADIIGRPVLPSDSPDLSALGAAYLAGLALGIWSSEQEIERIAPRAEPVEPRMSAAKRDELYAGWKEALARATLQ